MNTVLIDAELCMDLDFFLTEQELSVLPWEVDQGQYYSSDFLRACKVSNGEAVYVGTVDTYFPDPVSMTADEMEELIDFWVDEQEKTMPKNYQSRDEISRDVYNAAIEVPELIVKKTLARIKKAEASQC